MFFCLVMGFGDVKQACAEFGLPVRIAKEKEADEMEIDEDCVAVSLLETEDDSEAVSDMDCDDETDTDVLMVADSEYGEMGAEHYPYDD